MNTSATEDLHPQTLIVKSPTSPPPTMAPQTDESSITIRETGPSGAETASYILSPASGSHAGSARIDVIVSERRKKRKAIFPFYHSLSYFHVDRTALLRLSLSPSVRRVLSPSLFFFSI